MDDFDALSSYLAHILLYPRQIFVHPGVNPWKIVTSTLNPKTGHSHNCVAPTKVSRKESSPRVPVTGVPSTLPGAQFSRTNCDPADLSVSLSALLLGHHLHWCLPQAVGGTCARGCRPPANDNGLRSSEY